MLDDAAGDQVVEQGAHGRHVLLEGGGRKAVGLHRFKIIAEECGIQIVGIPRVSVKTSLQIEPPIEGLMAGLPFDERCSERTTKSAQG